MFVQTVLPIGKQEHIEPIKNLNDIINLMQNSTTLLIFM